MLEILSQHTKPNACWSWEADTIEDIYNKLEVEHDIRPDFEDYGNHINYSPKWLKQGVEEKYKGCVMIFTSPYVRLITDEKEVIERCEVAINAYKDTEEYKQNRVEYLEMEAEKKRVYREYVRRLMQKKA
jgi:hypothetical protein